MINDNEYYILINKTYKIYNYTFLFVLFKNVFLLLVIFKFQNCIFYKFHNYIIAFLVAS